MANKKHGLYGTPTYKSWAEMKYRCNKNIGNYKNIEYCKRWEKFECFVEDMGIRPANTTLDRINVYGNYEPNNCRWADIIIQENNKSNNVLYQFGNEKMTLNQIARKFNISRSNLANKVYVYKRSIEKAIDYLLEKRCLKSLNEECLQSQL